MSIKINRAPALTLWAAVVAERLGFDEALTLGRAVAGLNSGGIGYSAPSGAGAKADCVTGFSE